MSCEHVPMEFPGGAYPIMTFREIEKMEGDKYPSGPDDYEGAMFFGKVPADHKLPPLIGRVWVCANCKVLYLQDAQKK